MGPLISGISRWVKYYDLARSMERPFGKGDVARSLGDENDHHGTMVINQFNHVS